MKVFGEGLFKHRLLSREEWEPQAEIFYKLRRSAALRKVGGTAMPSTIFTNNLEIKYDLRMPVVDGITVPEVEVRAHWDLTDEALEVRNCWIERYGSEKAEDLCDSFTRMSVAVGALLANQIDKKANARQKTAYLHKLLDTPAARRRKKACNEVYFEYLQKAKPCYTMGPHVGDSIKEHEGSSWYPGHKYKDITSSQLYDLYNVVMEMKEWVIDHFEDILLDGAGYCSHPDDMFGGIRGRPPDGVLPLTGAFTGSMTQSREVSFGPAVSGGNNFMDKDNHDKLYNWFIEAGCEACDLSWPVFSPIKDKALVYERIKTSVEDNDGVFVPVDGKNHESLVPVISGRVGPGKIPVPNPQLGSGADDTTVDGTLQSMQESAALNDHFKLHIVGEGIHGDDQAMVLHPSSPIPRDIPGVVELDVPSCRCMRFLGIVMLDDEHFHPGGIPVTVDNSQKAVRIRSNQWISAELKPRYSDQERKVIKESFMGFLGGKPARQVLAKNEMNMATWDYISPSRILDAVTSIEDASWDPEGSGSFEESGITGLPIW